ncbi:PREDICTED: LOW QUALITY PROTEIN: uncharacterized protein LOC108532123 [Rhinopithecus bieti]|uniref:LOW QUALITY PROTEIN: uncharacterized protein LOC108532123 n=1 Tax=Rhinopithecus bieti TaxID=61621 RepID=UPI00083C5199|nr:PREDICTED: LOW QUALITY PROTEIN: uncharacterized protein LOC108532123 [Rhinopithecus bieti]
MSSVQMSFSSGSLSLRVLGACFLSCCPRESDSRYFSLWPLGLSRLGGVTGSTLWTSLVWGPGMWPSPAASLRPVPGVAVKRQPVAQVSSLLTRLIVCWFCPSAGLSLPLLNSHTEERCYRRDGAVHSKNILILRATHPPGITRGLKQCCDISEHFEMHGHFQIIKDSQGQLLCGNGGQWASYLCGLVLAQFLSSMGRGCSGLLAGPQSSVTSAALRPEPSSSLGDAADSIHVDFNCAGPGCISWE